MVQRTDALAANARLIAAAPEMYDALVALVNNPTRQAHYVEARAILKRIEGEHT